MRVSQRKGVERWNYMGGLLQILRPTPLNYEVLLIHSARPLGEVQYYKLNKVYLYNFWNHL